MARALCGISELSVGKRERERERRPRTLRIIVRPLSWIQRPALGRYCWSEMLLRQMYVDSQQHTDTLQATGTWRGCDAIRNMAGLAMDEDEMVLIFDMLYYLLYYY
ncbi:uncharacterized protein TrAFT101_010489 [Trichoderma asperellum]|uniref:uncharacterized protein n=1 Tax=Trichoderma asperellum TaxID=101201 RepID=UPI003331BE29|nr:hypothetical protein TrAFT101_010489 [Trichoderma asperellum]